MPNALDTANQFQADGRVGTGDHSDSFPVDVCYPQNVMSFGGWDAQGRTKVRPEGVDYDKMPENQNPRSVSDQDKKLDYDSQGKKL